MLWPDLRWHWAESFWKGVKLMYEKVPKQKNIGAARRHFCTFHEKPGGVVKMTPPQPPPPPNSPGQMLRFRVNWLMLSLGPFLHTHQYWLHKMMFANTEQCSKTACFTYCTRAHQHAVILICLPTVVGSCWAGTVESWQCLLALFLSCNSINHFNTEYFLMPVH